MNTGPALPTDILRVFVAPGELPQVVNAEAERSRVERYPSHGFSTAMFDRAIDRLMKVADKVLLYRRHNDDDELVMSRERRSSLGERTEAPSHTPRPVGNSKSCPSAAVGRRGLIWRCRRHNEKSVADIIPDPVDPMPLSPKRRAGNGVPAAEALSFRPRFRNQPRPHLHESGSAATSGPRLRCRVRRISIPPPGAR